MKRSEKTRVIGITGGVGCGKTEVLRFLSREFSAVCLVADEIGRELMRRGGECYAPVRDLFGGGVVFRNGILNRGEIAKRVFSDKGLLKKLEAIIHPAVKKEIKKRIDAARREARPLVFVETALFFEDHYEQICDEVWYVRADETARRKRLKKARHYTDKKIDSIMKNQRSDLSFRRRADRVIENGGDFSETKRHIAALLEGQK